MNICLIAEAGAGKDVVSEHLSDLYGYTRYAFADNVRKVAQEYFPHLYNASKKPRWLLQSIGTKFREIDSDVWVKSMFVDIDRADEIRKQYAYAKESIVVTDCRMPNEYQALKDRGFIFIRLTVDNDIRKQRMIDRGDIFNEEDLKHHTESFYDTFEYDYEISNNGTLEELKEEVDRVMDDIINRR